MPRATYVVQFQCIAVRSAVPPRTANATTRWLVDAVRRQFADATVTNVRPALEDEGAGLPSAASYVVTVTFHGRPPADAVATLAVTDGINYVGLERIPAN